MERTTVSRNQIINQILKIGHSNLSDYTPISIKAVQTEPELFAHLIAWNSLKGEVRDSKVALPVLALRGTFDQELTENAVAHLCQLDPRNLVRAITFNKELSKTIPVSTGSGKLLKSSMESYIRLREESNGWWDRTVLQHRKSMKALYALFHLKPSQRAQDVLFDGKKPKGSVFEAVAQLKNMNPVEAAGTILNFKIPFLVAVGAVGGIKKNPDIIMALIDRTSGSELVNNTGLFQRLGVFDNPTLKAAFDVAVGRAKQDKKLSTFKAAKAAEVIKDKKAAGQMKAVQEAKTQQLGGMEGDWLILADASGSMQQSVELAKYVASIITEQVKGDVHLVFFNTEPTRYDVTGLNLDQIKEKTRHIRAIGGTCIGCGLSLLHANNIIVNGIVIVSDGGENCRPAFGEAYLGYSKAMGIEPTAYHLWVPGEMNVLGRNCEHFGVNLQHYDVSRMDYYSIPNLIKTLRSNRYSLIEEIMATPLLRLADVLKRKE